ncbi:MAG: PEP-CTERM sorting domain-containing protein [Proteobacteria bacterium]|nr:PEP-CTERM sorting domain-containing protein [Pseudomonadota bacterium]
MKQHLWRRIAILGAGLGMALSAQAGLYSSLYVFGDSLSDAGNDLIITGGTVPTATYYTDGIHTGRFTNGLTYADRLASGLGLSLTASLSGGTDYAYGGARTTYVNPGLPPSALSFNQQIAAYDTTHAQADAGGLYVLWIGANDLADAIPLAAAGNPTAISSAITIAMQGIGSAIQDLSSKGAEHFLIPNVPDLSLTPQVRGNPPQIGPIAQGASQQFNAALDNLLAQYSTLDIRQLDIYGLQTDVTNNPAAYGFNNVSMSCYTGDVNGAALPGGPNPPTVCGTPGTYMYWDYEHPTDALHAVLGADALAAVVPEPASWALLAIGLGALGGLRARRRG